MRYLTIILLALFSCSGGGKWVETRVTNPSFYETVPAEMDLDLMFVRVKINGKDYRFLFDSGAPFSISSEVAKAIGFRATGSSITSSSGLKKGRLKYGLLKKVQIGDITFNNVTSYVIDFKRSIILDCLNFDGIVGSNLMNTCVWQLDPQNREITFTNDIDKLDLDGSYTVPMKKVSGQRSPHIPIKFNDAEPGYALFDTGSSHFITITYESYLSAKNRGKTNGIDIVTGRGLGSSGIFGSDDTTQFEIKLPKVKIGEEVMENVVTDMSHTDKTKVGMQFVRGRVVTLDFPNKLFHIKPTPNANVSNALASFGLSVRPDDTGSLIIGMLFENSPASEANLKLNSKVKSIDDIDLTMPENKGCGVFFQARDKLHEQDSIKLVVEEAGNQREVVLAKRILLQ